MMNWWQTIAVQLSAVQLHWVHEISQTALAAAVATLGVVIMLELRSISRLRRAVDAHLGKVFEQLNLMRSESQQLIEAQVRVPAAPARTRAAAEAASPLVTAMAVPAALGSGEAKLLAALAAARARLQKPEGQSPV